VFGRAAAEAETIPRSGTRRWEDRMMLALFQTRENLKAGLAATFGAEMAELIAERFCAAVAGRKVEIEAGSSQSGQA
jgi:hypothetical protein